MISMRAMHDTSPTRKRGGADVEISAKRRAEATSAPPRLRVGLVCLVFAFVSQAIAGESAKKLAAPLFIIGQPAREAMLISSNADGELRFATPDGETTVANGDIVSWGVPREADGGQILFADGSILIAEVSGLANENLSAVSATFGALDLPLTQLAAVLLHPPTDPWRRDALVRRLFDSGGESDRLLLENGDELSGTLISGDGASFMLNASIGAKEIHAVDVPAQNVAAIVFNPALRARPRTPPSHSWLGFADGSLILTEGWTLEEKQCTIARPDTRQWKAVFPSETRALQFVQPIDGRARYLSDVTPEAYRHIPYLGREWLYQLDRTVSGARLRAGERLYVKGIGMHSASRLTFAIDREFQRFEAELAIDDESHGGGSVVYRVFADAEERYRSSIIRGGEAPQSISVDVSGAQRISLVVDHAERGDQLDRADWLNARLTK